MIFALRRAHTRTESRRKRVLEGDNSLLADPNEHALPLPTTIRMQVNSRFQVWYTGIVMVIIVVGLVGVLFFVGGGDLFRRPLFLIVFGVTLLLTFGVLIGAFAFNRFLYNGKLRSEIVVNEQGITTHYFGKTTTVLWNESQSFDIWGGKTRRMRSFELVGGKNVVRWIVPQRYRAVFPFKPTTSYEEYCKKMGALEQVVCAKTHLKLYDLRDKKLVLL